jgi:hypothetical protein
MEESNIDCMDVSNRDRLGDIELKMEKARARTTNLSSVLLNENRYRIALKYKILCRYG